MLAEMLQPATRAATARFLGSGSDAVFTWHHAPVDDVRRGAGIVLCPALGYEYMSAYRTWRLLADRLAALGFDVIRLDYHGTGNSAGNPDDPNRVAAWLRSVAVAIDAARAAAGSDRIGLVGLRAGSLLALHAAAIAGGVDRLVLWSPFSSGRSYVRELKAIARLNGSTSEEDGPVLNVQGHLLSAETVQSLSGWSVQALTSRPAEALLLVERADRRAEAGIHDHLKMLGADVERCVVDGTAEMLLPPHLATVPVQALDDIVDWLNRWRTPGTPVLTRGAADVGCELGPVDGFCERPVSFGPNDRLFGMLTRPATSAIRAAVICLSTGAGHHVGPHRMYVPLAREWASRGHLVLRFDLGGIGDSLPADAGDAGDAYPARMLDDVRDAIALVRRQAPGVEVVLAGLCSGGWLAFDAARRGLDVDGIVSINPPLYLRDGNREWVRHQRRLDRYQRSVRDPMKWLKVLRGHTSTATAVGEVSRRLRRVASDRVQRLFSRRGPDNLSRDLASIARRGIRTMFIFSDGDNGLRYFEQHAIEARRRPEVRNVVRHIVVPDAGHAFQPSAAQHALTVLLNQFVLADSGQSGTVGDSH